MGPSRPVAPWPRLLTLFPFSMGRRVMRPKPGVKALIRKAALRYSYTGVRRGFGDLDDFASGFL